MYTHWGIGSANRWGQKVRSKLSDSQWAAVKEMITAIIINKTMPWKWSTEDLKCKPVIYPSISALDK